MVRADVGGIDCGQAILEHANPILTQAAYDRAARARPKVSRADAGLAIQRLADRRLQAKLEFFTAQDCDRLDLLGQLASEWR